MSERYGEYLRLPGYPDVLVAAWPSKDQGHWRIFYIGGADDLVAAGACTREMLASRGPGARKPRTDADGDAFSRNRYPIVRGGQVCERFRIWRHKPLERCLELPGAAAAIADYKHRHASPATHEAPGAPEDAEDGPVQVPSETVHPSRNRVLGRFQRPMRWAVEGKVISPDWLALRLAIVAGKVASS